MGKRLTPRGACFPRLLLSSEEFEKLVYCQISVANECPECSGGQLLVLWNRQVNTKALFGHDEMASDLSNLPPSGFSESLDGLFA